jgi:hypothetical protein
MRYRVLYAGLALFTSTFASGVSAQQHPATRARAAGSAGGRFEVSFPASLSSAPVTGRLFVCISPSMEVEPPVFGITSTSTAPCLKAYQSARTRTGRVPFYARDVDALKPGEVTIVDAGPATDGYPIPSLKDLPPGDYYVQAIMNVYTEFHRADGHTIWAHMDQWEGQRWAYAPDNLISTGTPTKVHLDPAKGFDVKIELTSKIPPIEAPADTKWVKHIKMQSPMLTKFWGHPIYVGAIVLLPKGYDENPTQYYPAVYQQSHFGLEPAFGFHTEMTNGDRVAIERRKNAKTQYDKAALSAGGERETGYEFYQAWNSDNFPRMIAVTLQHPTPYFDDSYAVNSANSGPYGDAILQELIPEIEKRFRLIPKGYARVLTGGSTGGWESIALQLYHPDFFGGTWTLFPDPIDFRHYQLTNIYQDDNAFLMPNGGFHKPERPMQQNVDGQTVATMRQISMMEHASGTHGRSAAQIDVWSATYGPVGADGYPRQLWDMKTGKIDREVAFYMRDHGYDLRDYAEKNWPTIGKSLVGKIHIYTGDMDNFFLAYAVYHMQDFLESTKDPYYAGEIMFGRPMKGHGWQPWTSAQLIKIMADHIAKNAPAGETTNWRPTTN